MAAGVRSVARSVFARGEILGKVENNLVSSGPRLKRKAGSFDIKRFPPSLSYCWPCQLL